MLRMNPNASIVRQMLHQIWVLLGSGPAICVNVAIFCIEPRPRIRGPQYQSLAFSNRQKALARMPGIAGSVVVLRPGKMGLAQTSTSQDCAADISEA